MALAITNKVVGSGDGSVKMYVYDNLDELDTTPAPIMDPEWSDRSVQVVGTFNGGTVLIEGSNDGVTYATLTDPQGNALSFTATKIEQVMEICLYMRPRVSAGTGLDVDVHILARRTSGMRN